MDTKFLNRMPLRHLAQAEARVNKAEQLAYGYGMSPERFKKWERKQRWVARWKWIRKWVGGTILCYITLC